jgi:hypothetical protein
VLPDSWWVHASASPPPGSGSSYESLMHLCAKQFFLMTYHFTDQCSDCNTDFTISFTAILNVHQPKHFSQ